MSPGAQIMPQTSTVIARPVMAIHSILIVEDDSDTLDAMRRILEPRGYSVSIATGGKEAIQSLNRRAFDLVITDILMPDVDGFQLIVLLRQNFPKTRCIAITGGGRINSDTYLLIARGFGADLVLPKPITNDTLVTAIRAIEARSGLSPPKPRGEK